MERSRQALLVLILPLLVLTLGCGRITELIRGTRTATPVPPTPTPTPTMEAEDAPDLTPANARGTAEPTSTLMPTSTPPAATPEPPKPTSEPPSPTPKSPAPTAEPAPTRIQFESGAKSATVTGAIEQSGLERYALRALDGQVMGVSITSPNNDVLLTIVGEDGIPLKRAIDGETQWRGELRVTQDYVIEAVSVGGETSYELMVTVIPRIQFAPGATSATVTSHIRRTVEGGVEVDEGFVLRALAGQTMEVVITSPNNDVLLSIVGEDGIPLKRYVDDSAEWQGVLPSTQDYFIKPVSVGNDTDYTLTVTTSVLNLSEPVRLQFETGATSATLEGDLDSDTPDRYVLGALSGQRMEIRVSSAGDTTVDIAVEGQDGSFWSALPWDGQLTIEGLPATQDYVITLALPMPQAGTVSYTMEVTIPPP